MKTREFGNCDLKFKVEYENVADLLSDYEDIIESLIDLHFASNIYATKEEIIEHLEEPSEYFLTNIKIEIENEE